MDMNAEGHTLMADPGPELPPPDPDPLPPEPPYPLPDDPAPDVIDPTDPEPYHAHVALLLRCFPETLDGRRGGAGASACQPFQYYSSSISFLLEKIFFKRQRPPLADSGFRLLNSGSSPSRFGCGSAALRGSQFWLMPHSFPTTGNAAQIVGRTPWSARVPPDPLIDTVKSARCDPRKADGGVGSGPGGPPHN